MAEEWRPVVGYEGLYEVSSAGRVKQVGVGGVTKDTWGSRLPRIMNGFKRNGYVRVRMRSERGTVSIKNVHVLVSESFLGPKPSPSHVVRHLDGTRDNNEVSNLAWGTPKENSEDRRVHGRDPNLAKTHCPQGHEYSEDNTYISPTTGHRQCKTCQAERHKARLPLRVEIRAKGLPPGSPLHGTENGYKSYGCRCDGCRGAASEAYQRRKRENTNQY